jgi:PIN domain nuclease of toxin-antitoxin system
MKLLLDTHTLLRLASGDVKLTLPARKAIADPAASCVGRD